MFDCESFGAACPNNWEDIAGALNTIAEREGVDRLEHDERIDAENEIWERWCNGEYPEVPECDWSGEEPH